ncbi:MAG: hypothetical protein AAB576_01945, partial [Elusimicrobiota bacterium]
MTDLEAARLAIRGALATIRDLQDANVRLKGNLQEAGSRERMASSENAELKKQLAQWEDVGRKWEEEKELRIQNEGKIKDRIRLEVREEERRRIDADRLRAEEELSRLAAEVEQWKSLHRSREGESGQLKDLLRRREAELVAAQREKADIFARI